MHPRLVELVDFLDRQRADLTDAVSGIPVERHTIVPPGGGWSVAEVMEHLVILEARVAKAFRLWIAEEKARVKKMIDETAGKLRAAGLRTDAVVKEEEPKRLLMAEAESWGADCIFVGARGMGRIERFLLGSVSSAVAARAHCSVEVVPDRKER